MSSSIARPTGSSVLSTSSNAHVVRAFLEAVHNLDAEAMIDLVDERIEYVNVSLSRVRGKKRFAALMRRGLPLLGGFDVEYLNIVSEGDVVATERYDTLRFGPLAIRFWVFGRFEVKDGKIVVWRDYFDNLNFGLGFVRGLLGIVIPPLRA